MIAMRCQRHRIKEERSKAIQSAKLSFRLCIYKHKWIGAVKEKCDKEVI